MVEFEDDSLGGYAAMDCLMDAFETGDSAPRICIL